VSFTKRHIDVQFQLGQGSFGGTSQNTVDVTGLRCSANVSKAGGWTNSTLELRIWGLSLSVMNDLSTLGKPLPAIRNNVVTLKPRSDDVGPTVAFIGVIQQAWADMQAMPESVFVVQATSGMLAQLRPLPPTSINGVADVAQVAAGLASQMSMNFTNGGVDIKIPNLYLSGTGVQQVRQLMDVGPINWIIEDNTLAIWPKDGSRDPNANPVVVSADTGLVGYPNWTAQGLMVKTLYNPNIAYGAAIQITSDITPANGVWSPFKIDHVLESEVPDGQWFSMIEAAAFGRPAVAT
jgi:hypothetical protein